MKIHILTIRTVLLFIFAALFSTQIISGVNQHRYNLNEDFSDTEKNLASILRNQKISDSSSQSDSSAASHFIYDFSSHKPDQLHLHYHSTEDHKLISQAEGSGGAAAAGEDEEQKKVMINFNNVNMVEYLRFVSRISNRNFVFDENDLQFNVTIISEEPATIENIMTALMQELLIHDLLLIEDGNNLIIHRNPKVNSISKVVSEDIPNSLDKSTDIITRVFRLNTLDPEKATALLRPLVSENALIEALKDNNQLIITDLTANIEKIAALLKSIDAPNSGLVIGQYVSRLTPIDTLIPMAQQIMLPISLDQPLTFVPQPTTNSIFIVSTPFLVERTISILEYLDQDQGATRIINLKDLRFGGSQITPRAPLKTLSGQWMSNAQGDWMFKPEGASSTGTTPPTGGWSRDSEGNWNFNQGATTPVGPTPKGRWVRDQNGNWVFQLDSDESFIPSLINRQFQGRPQLPGGVQKPVKFFIYKLAFRRGESVEPALRQIADTLQMNGRGSEELINTLRSVQWLVTPNSLVFSGTEESLARARELVNEIDTPMRQVLIDMLILESSLQDALQFGVTYGTRFGGGNISGSQAFISDASTTPLPAALATTGFANLGGTIGTAAQLIPNGTNLAQSAGFNLGVIGQKITHCGTEFGSIGALVNALHDRTRNKVISNPKILVEDGAPAELFVGINTPYRTQSISNDFGSVITSNFEYRDVGTRLRVTPYIGNGDIIAMDIEEEVSTIIAGLITNATTASTSPGPTTRINRTTTRVHIPDGYFLIISGMMQNDVTRARNQVPCLGGVPLLGAAFSSKNNRDEKRNLMIFIRPKIVDTEEEIQTITRHNQNIYDYKNCFKNADEYEWVEALDLFNIKKTLHPEDEYDCECECDSCGCYPSTAP